MTDVTERANISVDLWESGRLGREAEFAKRADEKEEAALDNALGLQMISIRLPRKLIDQLKLIASVNGVGYQPLIRDVLGRFARNELAELLRQRLEMEKLEKKVREASSRHAETPPARPRAKKAA